MHIDACIMVVMIVMMIVMVVIITAVVAVREKASCELNSQSDSE